MLTLFRDVFARIINLRKIVDKTYKKLIKVIAI